jgi:hypothetical protein
VTRTVSNVSRLIRISATFLAICSVTAALSSCSHSESQSTEPRSDKSYLIADIERKTEDAGGLVLSTNSATMLIASNFKDYDVTSNSGLHFVFVNDELFIDSSTPGTKVFTRGTPEVLEQKGVPRERAARDAARTRVMLKILGDFDSYLEKAVVEPVDLASLKVSIPSSALGVDGALVDMGKNVELLFTLDGESIRSLSYASLATDPFYITKFTKVVIKEPDNVKG